MTYYRRIGMVPPKRHAQFRDELGHLYTEELVGEQGFFYASSLLYHRNLPNVLLSAEPVAVPALTSEPVPNLPLVPRKFQTHALEMSADAVSGRRTIVQNEDVRISYALVDCPSPLFRDALGDEVVFVEDGAARLETSYGALDLSRGDYVRLPMGTIHRWLPAPGPPVRLFILEGRGHVTVPNRYLSPRGQLLEHAPYSERDLRAPTEPLVVDEGETEVLVRHRDGVTRHVFAEHPFDVVGWDGCVYPMAFSIYDFEPIVKRFHAPPPVHETFAGPDFVVCSFCPRPVDFDEKALPAPYAHSANDCDELMFFVAGDYTIRKGVDVGPGTMTFHPAGFVHGPHPGGAEASLTKTHHEEYAVMVDTFRPLSLGVAAVACADTDYYTSWARGLRAARA
jgi:homogentisate 1,2-dioxygenase